MPLQMTYPNCPLVLEIKNPIAPAWNPVCHITYDHSSWVKLLQPPSEYSFDEAMLLCQESLDTWFAWVPEYGEILLDRSDFYC